MKLLEFFAKQDDLCNMDGTGKCNNGINFDTLLETFGKNIITSLFTIVGIASVIAIIICGIMMMTSAGDAGKVAKAKKGLLAAIIGLIISMLAFAIVSAIVSLQQPAS